MNPITQRSTTSGQQNGVGSQVKNNTHKGAMNQESNTEKLANERLVYLLGNFMVSERDQTEKQTWGIESLTYIMAVGASCHGHIEKR